jgi:hypothetical protein
VIKVQFIIDNDAFGDRIAWKVVEQGYVPQTGDHFNLFADHPDGPWGPFNCAVVKYVCHGVGAPPRVHMMWTGQDPKLRGATEKEFKEFRKNLKKFGWRQRNSPQK